MLNWLNIYQISIAFTLSFGLLGTAAWLLHRYFHPQAKENLLRAEIQAAEKRIKMMNQRLDAVFRVNQISVQASEENEVVALALQLVVELTGVQGATFVPLDDHSQPIATNSFGVEPGPELDAWLEYLASPAIHARCDACRHYESVDTCPLLHKRFESEICLLCFPLERGDHKFGVLNLYMPKKDQLDAESRSFLQAMADEIALVLEGVRLRRRELAALSQLQDVRAKSDISAMLHGMMKNVCGAFDSDYTKLVVRDAGESDMIQKFSCGELSDPCRARVDSLVLDVVISGKPMLQGEDDEEKSATFELRSLMAAPLIPQGGPVLGALLVSKHSSGAFQSRQLALLETIAGQAALLIDSSHRMADVKYKTIFQERTRLAREIHDGLAQTLGFLKLQIAQMKRTLEDGEISELKRGVDLSYQAVTEAYDDAREAIDGLNIDAHGNSFVDWLHQTIAEFEENSGIPARIKEMGQGLILVPEVQIQLIRIIQEALSNVRKHSGAQKVEITCHEIGEGISVEICDDGRGFYIEEMGHYSRHGLRGMQERADLIDAAFEISSLPGKGTTIHVHWMATPAEILA